MSGPETSGRLSGPAVLAEPLVGEMLSARAVALLATFDTRGSIHAVPMWFAFEDDAVLLATGSRSRKVVNLTRDPRATLVVHDSRSGFEVCGVSISGRVEILRAPTAYELIERVHRRYVSTPGTEHPLVREFLASDDVALRLHPESAWVWDERENEAAKALRSIGGALPLLPTEPRKS